MFSEFSESSKGYLPLFVLIPVNDFRTYGVDLLEKSLFFKSLFSCRFSMVSEMDLIFGQKKFLVSQPWLCQNKTPKFDLLTLLNN